MVQSLHLSKRGGTYYFRCPIPLDMQPWLGVEFKRSLQTEDHCIAANLASELKQTLDALYIIARSGMLKVKEIKQLIEKFTNHHRLKRVSDREWPVNVPIFPEDLDTIIQNQKALILLQERFIDANDYKFLSTEVDEFLNQENISVKRHIPEYIRLSQGIQQGIVDVEKEELAYLLENYNENLEKIQKAYNANFYPNGIPEEIENTEEVKAEPLPQPSPLLTHDQTLEQIMSMLTANACVVPIKMSEALSRYIGYLTSNNPDGKSAIDNYTDSCSLFIEIIGDIEISKIDDIIVNDFINTLKNLPSYRKTKNIYKKRTIRSFQNNPAQEEDKISITTVNKHIENISTILNYAVKIKILKNNYMRGIKYHAKAQKKAKTKNNYKAYSIDEIKKILFEIELLRQTKEHQKRPERYWIVLIGLFTGMRQNEICQLYLEDIHMKDGVWVFDIVEDKNEQLLKTPESERKVPIHPYLLEKGFLDYLKTIQKHKSKRVWPNLTYTVDKHYRGKFEGWFGRFRRAKITTENGKNFHSFRATFNTNLKLKGVAVEDRNYLLGHLNENIDSSTYLDDLGIEFFFDIICKIDFHTYI